MSKKSQRTKGGASSFPPPSSRASSRAFAQAVGQAFGQAVGQTEIGLGSQRGGSAPPPRHVEFDKTFVDPPRFDHEPTARESVVEEVEPKPLSSSRFHQTLSGISAARPSAPSLADVHPEDLSSAVIAAAPAVATPVTPPTVTEPEPLGETLMSAVASERVEPAPAAAPARPVAAASEQLPPPVAVAPLATAKTAGRDAARDAEAARNAEDEASIPPAPDLDDSFFDADHPHSADMLISGSHDLGDDSGLSEFDARRKALAGAASRRAQFAKYVKVVVGVAAVLCIAGVARVSISRVQASRLAASRAEAAVFAPATTVAATGEPEVAPAQAAATEVVVDNSTEGEPVIGADQLPTDIDPSTFATALEAKHASRALLERRRLAESALVGERAVALDPLDAESWLLLGAAYQEQGNMLDARRCYVSCAKQAKRGDVAECRALISK